MSRIEFLESVKKIAASRAGYRCSIPQCDRVTVGPALDPNKFNNTGCASHIYAASAKGPRGNFSLSPDEIGSAANALWVCRHHGDLIDKDRGSDYPPDLLLRYKAVHEAKIAREVEGVYVFSGWISEARFESSPLFANPFSISLGKLNLFYGDNGLGKTALAEWIASVSITGKLGRWKKAAHGWSDVSLVLDYLDPEPHSFGVSVIDGLPKFTLDGRATVLSSAPIKVVFPKDIEFYRYPKLVDELHLVSDLLNLDPLDVINLAGTVAKSGTGRVKRIEFVEENVEWEDRFVKVIHLIADVEGTLSGLNFCGLSGSEQARVVMELAILAANHFSKANPTLLVLDGYVARLDDNWLSSYGEFLSSPTIGFQTIASIPTRRAKLDEVVWTGWKVFTLGGEPPNVTINH